MVHRRTHVADSVHAQQLRACLYSEPVNEVCMLAVISWAYHTCSRDKWSSTCSKTGTFTPKPLDVILIQNSKFQTLTGVHELNLRPTTFPAMASSQNPIQWTNVILSSIYWNKFYIVAQLPRQIKEDDPFNSKERLEPLNVSSLHHRKDFIKVTHEQLLSLTCKLLWI